MGGFSTDDNHQEVIDEHAKQGWRLVQVMPIGYTSEGRPTRYEIIFERRIGES